VSDLFLLCCFDRTALENLQKEHQRALEHVVESKDKEIDVVAHAKDHARWVVILPGLHFKQVFILCWIMVFGVTSCCCCWMFSQCSRNCILFCYLSRTIHSRRVTDFGSMFFFACNLLFVCLYFVPPLPPLGLIWDVMLVWRKGNVGKTVSVLQYCILL